MKRHSLKLRLMGAVTVLVLLMGMAAAGSLRKAAASDAGVAEDAGTWPTWVLKSGDTLRPDAPPDEAATKDEIAALMDMVAKRDEGALNQIAYWNAGPPSYRWNQIMVDTLLHKGVAGNMAARDLTLFNVAIYDATIAAWDGKYAYKRPRPAEIEPGIQPVIAAPNTPSYPSEYAVTAGAASAILGWLFPDDAQKFEDMAQAAVHSRLMAGVEYPSDVEAGLKLGKAVAELVIEVGKNDGSAAPWTGSVPTEPGHWTGENPIFPTGGTWKAWVLTSPDQFRPGPPPAPDSDQMAAEMDEVRSFERTPTTNSIAQFWEYGSGGRRFFWFWNEQASRSILEAGWSGNAPVSARAYALVNIAQNDAIVACWDAKYTYWAMRPFQVDPKFIPLFATPNHPGYPSAHSCISTAVTNVLAYLYPADAAEFLALGQEASESRIWAGIHFRADVVAGRAVGQSVGETVIAHAENGAK